MSPFDVPPDEMGMDPEATDEALDRIITGAGADDEWQDVTRFAQELQEAVPSSGLPSEDLHVAAMVETAHLLAEKGDPAVRPVSNAAGPAPQASGLPKQRRKPMKWKFAKVLAPIAAVLTVFGGMAYAGALPRPVQHAVSHTAGTVGLNLPGDEDGQGEDAVTDDTEDPAAIATDDQGENDDSQGDNDNQGEDTQGDSSDDQGESSDTSTSSDDQGENDDSQGDNDNQGEDTQGDGGSEQSLGGDQSQDSQDSQGDGGSDTSSGDQSGDSQD
jgi:hypothetical protein